MTWQPTAVIYPDAELVVATDLRALLVAEGETVWVGRKFPGTRPSRAIQVIRDGGPIANLRDVARLRFNVWGTSDQNVGDLSRLVVAVLPRLVGESGVLRVSNVFGPSEVPTDTFRRLVNAEIDLRGEAL